MIEEAGLVAGVSSALTALLGWFTVKLRESIKKTTDEAAGVIDWPKMRSEVDDLLEFRKGIDAEREREEEAARRALEDENAELKRQLELHDSAASRTSMQTKPLRGSS